jgi:integrase
MTPNTWWTFLDGREVASARMAWAKTSAYLGWLGLPPASGGMAMPRDELDTLAWLVVPNYLEKFLDWTATRAGKRNQGTIHFLAWIAALVRPRTGYLRQRPELLTTLPTQYHFEDWENLCHRQFELTEQLVAAYYKEIEVSRDSFAPIKHIIEMRQPMDAIVDMVRRMRADRPISTPWREALWSRDIVLIKLLSCLALRRRNFAHLTWRADNTGDLHQRSDKSWWIRLPKSKFKNTHGAAGEAVYDCQIHPSAWRDIERYLFKDRQSLMRHPTDLLFLTRESGANEQHVPWADLSRRVHVLTANYIPRCAGFGSHAFRHIIATSILKADGGDYKTVAKILNDRVATVEKHYDGLRSNDAAQRMGQLLHAQFAQM